MRFWDASAVVPLLVREPAGDAMIAALQADSAMVVWWGTSLECASALARRERSGDLDAEGASVAFARLRALAREWDEVLPGPALRNLAQRLLRVHPLRSGDALQLAAALIAAEHQPESLAFVCLDDRLRQAAEREGFVPD
jgi:predicted nucleic acid-binding protein